MAHWNMGGEGLDVSDRHQGQMEAEAMSDHEDKANMTRRDALRVGAGAAAAALASKAGGAEGRVGKFQQSASLWCYKKGMTLDELCVELKQIGMVGVDLCGPKEWPTLKKHGLVGTMTGTHGLTNGLAEPDFHEDCLKRIRESIDATAAEGFRNVITFSGNRRGMDDEVGLENCVKALKQVAGYAEQKKVCINLEYLNSAKNHKDYMADSTKWCVELVRRVGSERVKVLYDIYHAGVMGEDILADIRDHHECWGHYHTGGVPGRHEIDDKQTLDYPAIMKAIAETGFDGYVAHEFIPERDP
ncbi:MAG: sugar phosphate isomerase/epimerase family protein, partial [Candidatus Brocadiaceae bacterium]